MRLEDDGRTNDRRTTGNIYLEAKKPGTTQGLWVLAGALITVALVSWSALIAGMDRHSIHWKNWEGLWVFILAVVPGGMLAAFLYGLCLRALSRGTGHFHLVSLYPAAFLIIPLLICALFVMSESWWARLTGVAVFVLTLALTIAGWWGRRPGLYLMALSATGIPITAVGAYLSVYLLNSPVVTGMDGIGTVLGFLGCFWILAVGSFYVEAVTATAIMVPHGSAPAHETNEASLTTDGRGKCH